MWDVYVCVCLCMFMSVHVCDHVEARRGCLVSSSVTLPQDRNSH